MKKKIYTPITLTCVLQQDNEMPTDTCLCGVMSRTSKGFRFEEAIRKGRAPRNPKLYDGQYVTMVRMRNGRYQMHLKTMQHCIDHEKYAFGVYSEITNALKIID